MKQYLLMHLFQMLNRLKSVKLFQNTYGVWPLNLNSVLKVLIENAFVDIQLSFGRIANKEVISLKINNHNSLLNIRPEEISSNFATER